MRFRGLLGLVGGEQDVQVDVRVVTSTARDLKLEIAEGRTLIVATHDARLARSMDRIIRLQPCATPADMPGLEAKSC